MGTKKTAKRVISKDEWIKIQGVWEGEPTMTFTALSQRLGGHPTGQAIGQRAKRETWTRVNVKTPEIQRGIAVRADEKSMASPQPEPMPPAIAGPSPLAKHAAIEARATIIDRHRRELNYPRQRLYDALQQGGPAGFDKAKLAKISAETLSIVQAAERKAWGLDGDPTIVFQVIPPSERDQHD